MQINKVVNIKPYSSGNKIKRIENPIIGKIRKRSATAIDEEAISFSITKQNREIGTIKVKNADNRFSFNANEPIQRLIKKHNKQKNNIKVRQSLALNLRFFIWKPAENK